MNPNPKSTESILVVDDTEDLRKQLVYAVEGSDRKVICAASAEEAIKVATSTHIDAAVVDLRLIDDTDEGGFDVLRKLKECDLYTQVIVVTSRADAESEAKAMRLGAFDYLDRARRAGSYLRELRDKVGSALEFRRRRVEASQCYEQ